MALAATVRHVRPPAINFLEDPLILRPHCERGIGGRPSALEQIRGFDAAERRSRGYIVRHKSVTEKNAMPSPETNVKLAGTFARVAVAAFFWLALLVVLVVIVPVQKKVFDSWGLALPQLTQLVVDVSMWFADYWWIAVPCMLPGLAFVALATWYFCYADNPRWLRTAWTLLIIALPMALTIIVVISLIIPQMKLAQGLAK
jgi:hypothetical protein